MQLNNGHVTYATVLTSHSTLCQLYSKAENLKARVGKFSNEPNMRIRNIRRHRTKCIRHDELAAGIVYFLFKVT